MLNLSKIEIAEKANKLNFPRDTMEKVLRLADILGYLNTNPLTKDVLALKGGTAINLTVFSLPRLSVDIDLDYSMIQTREEMLESRMQITEAIATYMATQGYVQSLRSRLRYSLDSFVFEYQNHGGMKDNIKIEINYSLRAHILPLERREITESVIPQYATILSVAPMEVFAGKMNALMSRAAARDLYDTYNMIHYGLFAETEFGMLRKAVVFYTAISQDEIPTSYNFGRIDGITMRRIKTELLPVIRKGEFVDLADMKKDVRQFLETLLVLTDDERNFLNLFSEKEYCPELLFGDVDILRRINLHPMVQWKMQEH